MLCPRGHDPPCGPDRPPCQPDREDDVPETTRDARPLDEQTLGQLVATATRDLSLLLHKEVELAKSELLAEAKRAGLGAGLLGGAGAMGFFAAVFLSIAAAFGISALGVSLGIGFLCVGGA